MINDPVTAVHAVGHVADLLVKLTGRRFGGPLRQDADGVDRIIVLDRDPGTGVRADPPLRPR